MLGNRIKKLILVRLLLATCLLYCPQVFPSMSGVIFYGVAAVVCGISGLYVIWLVIGRRLRWLAIGQTWVDVALETYLIFVTGGTESAFATFFVLTILGTAFVLGERKQVLAVTGGSCAFYFGGSLASFVQGMSWIPRADPLYFMYGTLVKMIIFLVIGNLSCRLSEAVRELQEKLKLSERLSSLGEVVGKIAHEIRNPLSAIRTAAEVLRESLRGKLTEQEERMIAIVDAESDRLTQTLQRILSYTRQVQPNPKELLLDPVMERVLVMARMNSTVHSDGIVVEKQYDTQGIHVYADEEQIVGALLNLTLNAFQAMPSGGTYRIDATEDRKGTEITMRDTGGGIPKEKVKDLFAPFKSTKKGGTGLGLAEVQKIVTLHEGKIEVETHPGEGTEFHLYFPKP